MSDTLKELAARNESLVGALKEQLSEARQEIVRLNRLLLSDVRTSVILELARRTKTAEAFVRPNGKIAVRVTQQALANSVFYRRETISKCVSDLKKEGLLDNEGRHGFVVVSVELLRLAESLSNR